MGLSSANQHRWLTAVAVLVVLGLAWFIGAGVPRDSGGAESADGHMGEAAAKLSMPPDSNPGRSGIQASMPPSSPKTDADSGTQRDDLRTIDILSIVDGQQVLDMFGSERNFKSWADARGLHLDPNYQSPYALLSIEELKELVAAGDTAAKVALARQLRGVDPEAALDILYGVTMEAGSVEAMIELATLYGGIEAALRQPEIFDLPPEYQATLASIAEQGVDPALEGMAWGLLFDSYAGFPRTMRGADGEDALLRFHQACDRAVELRESIETQAAARGQPMPDIEPAPWGIISMIDEAPALSVCPGERLPTADFTDCRAVEFYGAGQMFEGFVCP